MLPKAYALFFLAMAQQQLGREAEAQQSLAHGVRLAESEPKQPVNVIREVTLIRLRKEAEALVGVAAPATAPAAE